LNQDIEEEEEQEKFIDKLSDVHSDNEEDERIHNPLKIPIGWDGKPIPYWLFKLYGLGIEYKCEICGGYVYMGRKAFERHFQEARHSNGLRCLGIPNSRYFNEIIFIDDAVSLWEKLKTHTDEENEKAKMMEEFEDTQGNIFNKRTYDDLRKQGLL
jgi:splicing factor 3A subunit 3